MKDALAARLGTVKEVVARSLRELERSGANIMNKNVNAHTALAGKLSK